MFEFYCFIQFKLQNGAFQDKFYEFGSRGFYDTLYLIYVMKWYVQQ